MLDSIFGFALQLILAAFTAYVAVRLSIRQFRSQHWYERQAEAYSKILEELGQLKYSFNEWVSEATGIKDLREEQSTELGKQYRAARAHLALVCETGAFVVSPATADALNELEKSLIEAWKLERNPIESLEEAYASTEQATRIVRQEAQKALKMRPAGLSP